ncbi:hypothetical protein VC83_03400 [Pseudogymnoascus destructans]|uniref:ABM domain-containing protein n=2 Tax=Pseudogymnoascus destructans TaxID=655981 RepID=L8FSI0_PSED2|nr:uncharacterized protein VC83_03400 [Pseudogymnoascus destructans]ELR03524.1 hypothetical protein GMDG_01275 [Pseudogymnoascus destructans 20631-21]OAF60562.1 hypothetical protein VC83_03400 [Pseudogymnoascus destructans]
MSQPITEIVQVKFKSNISIEDQMPEFTRLLERQLGFLQLAWGRWVESPDNVQMLLNWDTIESHHRFEKSGADYAALGVIVKSLVAEPPVVYHVNFKSDNGLTISAASAA